MTTSERARLPGMIDARQRVTGRVPYTIDIAVPGMQHARLLRSTMAHARIVRIDTTAARALRGVSAVVTGADLVARGDLFPYFGPVFRDQPILAIDKVRFIGEPVAGVVAVDLDTAQRAVDLIEVEYEELPAVFDAEAALAPGAPLVHDGPPRTGPTYADIIVRQEAGTNVCNYFRLRKGDVAAGFAQADHVFEDVFTSPPVQHVPMETHVTVADARPDGITVWSSTQHPFADQASLAEIFRLPESAIRVVIPTLGGGYGSKGYPKIEPVTAALSLVARRPVRLHLTREEEFLTITKHAVSIRMKTGVMRDGTIVARQSTCLFNTGAYADVGPRLIKNGGFGTGGPHRIPNVWVDSYAVYTNIVPAGAFRGYGVTQAAWAYDSQLDMIAERLGLDPHQVRMRNLLEDGDTLMTGEPMVDSHLRELTATAATAIGWEPAERGVRTGHRVRGKGLSTIVKATVTPSTSTAQAKLGQDGSLYLLISAVEMGQGVKTAMAILGAERLGVPVDQVRVSSPDTDVTPYDQATGSSRSTFSMGSAVLGAVDQVRDQLLRLAADELEIAVGDLEIVAGRVQARGAPEKGVAAGAIVRRTRSGNLLGQHTFRTEGELDPETGQGIGSVHWHQAAAAAEVEVDLQTGKVDVLRAHAGVYAGRIVNPVQAELQTEGNVAFGLGQALLEEMVFDRGQLQNGNLADYMIASIEDLPEIDVNVLEHLEANEIHGIGESTLPPVVAAIGNAVHRATGVRITDLPITPEKVLRGLRALEEASRT